MCSDFVRNERELMSQRGNYNREINRQVIGQSDV